MVSNSAIDEDVLRRDRLRARAVVEATGNLAFKPLSSAKWVDVARSAPGRIRSRVEHDTIRGVTPQMFRWWCENISGTTTWNGVDFSGPELPMYLLWHHRDHIAVTPLTDGSSKPNRGLAVGGKSRIQENFGDYHDAVDATVLTDVLDDNACVFRMLQFGQVVGRMVHTYAAEPAGLQLYVEIEVGVDLPLLGSVLNWTVLPRFFSVSTAENSIRHSIEEMGRLEQILPPLYEHAMARGDLL